MSCTLSPETAPQAPAPKSTCASPVSAWVPGPPRLLLMAVGAMPLLHLVLPLAALPATPWRLLGLVPLAAGVALNLLADRDFRRAGTTVKPMLPSSVMLEGGVFRLTRNPMYLGMILILLGLWLTLGSLTPGAPAIAFALLIDRYFVRPEEEKLERTFGAAYAAYRARVRRWI
jgi:protein-S-isoprenylcysteine O-methyltransferase Ste14